VTPGKPDSVALLMKHLGQRYVQYINRTYRRSGTLWEGRFRSCLARDEEYVLGCYRYIELNPVRATMVEHPRDYPWSSYRANGDGGSRRTRTIYAWGPLRRPIAHCLLPISNRSCWQRFAMPPTAISPFGSQRFKDEVALMLGRRVVPGRSGRPRSGEGPG
jgi:Transposase and inactivated derivatives